MQVSRLEEILIKEDLLVDNTLVKSNRELDLKEREDITDAVDFISYSREGEKPDWFIKDLNSDTVFEDSFGFKKAYKIEEYPGQSEYFSTNLTLATQSIDISDYNLSINVGANERDRTTTIFENKGNKYELIWDSMGKGIPKKGG